MGGRAHDGFLSEQPRFADGLRVQRVLDAVETSSDTRTWQEIPTDD